MNQQQKSQQASGDNLSSRDDNELNDSQLEHVAAGTASTCPQPQGSVLGGSKD